MVSLLIIYVSMAALAFLVCSITLAAEEGVVKVLLIVTFFNIFFMIYYMIYKLLRKLVRIKGKNILGHNPRTAKDFNMLGASKNNSPYSWVNLFRMLFKNKHDMGDVN